MEGADYSVGVRIDADLTTNTIVFRNTLRDKILQVDTCLFNEYWDVISLEKSRKMLNL